MSSHKDTSALADEAGEELQGMLPGPPTRAASRWSRFGLAAAVLVLAGVGLRQAGLLPLGRSRSALEHISMVHRKIDAIVAAAVTTGDINSKIELLVDDYSKKGSPPKAMEIHAHMKMGDEKKRPMVRWDFDSHRGKNADLKAKLEDIFHALLGMADKRDIDEIKDAVKIFQTAGGAAIQVTPPARPEDRYMDQHEADFKAALKEHKPHFHGTIAVARTFEEMLARDEDHLLLAPRGVEVHLEAAIANTVFELLSDMHGMNSERRILEVLRMARVRNELFYASEDALTKGFPHFPVLGDALKQVCAAVPGPVSKELPGLDDVLKGLHSATLEGLPYGWEVTLSFEHVNPAPVLERCKMDS